MDNNESHFSKLIIFFFLGKTFRIDLIGIGFLVPIIIFAKGDMGENEISTAFKSERDLKFGIPFTTLTAETMCAVCPQVPTDANGEVGKEVRLIKGWSDKGAKNL